MMLMREFLPDMRRQSARLRFANDDIAVGAVDDSLQLRLLSGRHAELVSSDC